jgi:hypothetical protein
MNITFGYQGFPILHPVVRVELLSQTYSGIPGASYNPQDEWGLCISDDGELIPAHADSFFTRTSRGFMEWTELTEYHDGYVYAIGGNCIPECNIVTDRRKCVVGEKTPTFAFFNAGKDSCGFGDLDITLEILSPT